MVVRKRKKQIPNKPINGCGRKSIRYCLLTIRVRVRRRKDVGIVRNEDQEPHDGKKHALFFGHLRAYNMSKRRRIFREEMITRFAEENRRQLSSESV